MTASVRHHGDCLCDACLDPTVVGEPSPTRQPLVVQKKKVRGAPSEVFEARARERKAAALAALLQARGVSPEKAASFALARWKMLAAEAGVRAPSTKTVAVVVAKLAEAA